MKFDIQTFGGPVVQTAAQKVIKHAPEILTGVGILGGITAAVLGARATLKLEPVVEAFEEEKDDAVGAHSIGETTDKEYRRELTKAYAHFTIRLGKLYGGPLALGVGSTISILAAHGLMKRREVALIAVVKTLETAFGEYRKRVIEEFGPEKDQMYRFGITEEKIEDENGKKKTVRNFDPNKLSGYARWFDEGNINYQKGELYNASFLKSEQNYANDRLQARGYLFLSEVYERLGFEISQASTAVGWRIGGDGDNYVDFGIFGNTEKARDFINGLEKSVILDFNVDGVILGTFPKQ